MRNRVLKQAFILMLAVIAAGVFLGGCAAPQFKPRPYTAPQLDVDQYDAKADILMILLDASASMTRQEYNDQEKINIAQDFLYRLNQTIPDMDLQAGMRVFGQDPSVFLEGTSLVYGITDYNEAELTAAINAVQRKGLTTPIAAALRGAEKDLEPTQGPIALVFVSDGIDPVIHESPLDDELKVFSEQFGDRLCFYSVGIGNNEDGLERMKEIAEAFPCGSYINADDLESAGSMAGFVERVLLSKRLDSDGDGVYDKNDECPDTPAGVEVDDKGCAVMAAVPMAADGDGDGVPDDSDKCTNTPMGAEVSPDGCRVLEMIHFDFDESNIESRYESIIQNAAAMLRDNPELEMEIHGHTDSIGTAEYNQKLSERRARSVNQHLVDRGIDPQRLSTTGHGFRRPIATNETDAGRAENRRVELKPAD